MTIRAAVSVGLLCLLAALSALPFARAQEKPDADGMQTADEPSTDAEMQWVADQLGIAINEQMVAATPSMNASLDGMPPLKRPCVLRVLADEMRRAQAASLRVFLPKHSDIVVFEHFAATDGGRKLLATFRASLQDAMAGRNEGNRFEDMGRQLTTQERADIERFMRSPQSAILGKHPGIEQPVGGMSALERRVARECQVS